VYISHVLGFVESHARTAAQPWSPISTGQTVMSPNQDSTNTSFNYPSESILNKWKKQEYSPWNQQRIQAQATSIPMTREGIENLRQRLMEQNTPQLDQQYKPYAGYNQRGVNQNYYSPSQAGTSFISKHFTDL
jgi:hypothetical protein